MAKVPWWVWVSVVACAGASLVSLSSRHRVEVSNRAVGIMMSMEDIEAIAATSVLPTSTILHELQKNGLTGVAFSEQSVGDLVDRGDAKLVIDEYQVPAGDSRIDPLGPFRTEQLAVHPTISEPDVRLVNHPELGTTADLAFARKMGVLGALGQYEDLRGRPSEPWTASLHRMHYWIVPENLRSSVLDLSVGIDSRYARVANAMGLQVVARLDNSPLITSEILTSKIRGTSTIGASAFLIRGDQAIGNRELIETTRDALIANDMQYISPEFVTLGGDAYLRRELADRTLRLHSISAIEAERMSAGALNERFAKAFRERGARWLLLRPNTKASDDPLKQVGETLASLRSAIQSAGGEVKEPRPFEDEKPSIWLVCLIGALAIPAAVWAAVTALGRGVFSWSVYALFVLLCVLTVVSGDAKNLALLMALAFPVIAFQIVRSLGKTVPIRDFLLFTSVSMVGGLAVGAMLTGVEFIIRADQFTGTKLVIFGPLLVIGFLLLRQHGTIKELMAKPVTWGMATLAIAGLAAMFMLVARSGNENPAAVSGLELQIRSLLDQLLFVRPRSKEVILGHPALVLGLMMMAHRPNLRGWASLLLFVGIIGQTSVVNTFCHLHTPIALSLARVGTGVVCGGIIGLLLWVAVKRWIPAGESK